MLVKFAEAQKAQSFKENKREKKASSKKLASELLRRKLEQMQEELDNMN